MIGYGLLWSAVEFCKIKLLFLIDYLCLQLKKRYIGTIIKLD